MTILQKTVEGFLFIKNSSQNDDFTNNELSKFSSQNLEIIHTNSIVSDDETP